MDKHDPMEQLVVAFGKKRAKKIIKEINQFKNDNPDKAFSFVFAEDGSFQAVLKSQEPKEEEETDATTN